MTDPLTAIAAYLHREFGASWEGDPLLLPPTNQEEEDNTSPYLDHAKVILGLVRPKWQPISEMPGKPSMFPGDPDTRPVVFVTRVPFVGDHAPIFIARLRKDGRWRILHDYLRFKPTHFLPVDALLAAYPLPEPPAAEKP